MQFKSLLVRLDECHTGSIPAEERDKAALYHQHFQPLYIDKYKREKSKLYQIFRRYGN